jgi:phage FluMu gp28-like protein
MIVTFYVSRFTPSLITPSRQSKFKIQNSKIPYMSAILPFTRIDHDSFLADYFTGYQLAWIHAEDPFHERKKQVFALAEKSVRIGWTFCDGFKNVRKRLRFKKRDYLFVTRDWPSALEYMNHVYDFADMFGFTRAVLSHGEDVLKVKALTPDGHPTSITEEVKIGYIKFDNGSRIIAFSSNPYAMAVYGGDVGLDEFAKHPNASLLWQTAQARVTWNFDMAVWSSHDGEDTLFNQFVQQARSSALCLPLCPPLAPGPLSSSNPAPSEAVPLAHPVGEGSGVRLSAPLIENQKSKIKNPSSPWNVYFKVTMPDAIELGLIDLINRTQDTALDQQQFLADCQARAGSDEIFQQSYLCNPQGASAASIVEWSAIERCRADYEIERVHLESADVLRLFGEFNPSAQDSRESKIQAFLEDKFPGVLSGVPSIKNQKSKIKNRLGFDVAASGQGDLAAFYIDQLRGSELWLGALLTARTEDWHFLKTVLFYFLKKLPSVQGAGDESGLGRQICWEAASQFPGRFLKVNFAAKKHDLGFALMNQLSVSEKRFPRAHADIAADFFALRKVHTGTRWIFNEGRNTLNPASHCDIAWAGALASFAHAENKGGGGLVAYVAHDSPTDSKLSHEQWLIWGNDSPLWKPWGR